MNFTKTQKAIIKDWFNDLNIKYKSSDDIKKVYKHHKLINSYIMEGDYSLGTKGCYINLLSIIMHELGHERLYNKYDNIYKTLLIN